MVDGGWAPSGLPDLHAARHRGWALRWAVADVREMGAQAESSLRRLLLLLLLLCSQSAVGLQFCSNGNSAFWPLRFPLATTGNPGQGLWEALLWSRGGRDRLMCWRCLMELANCAWSLGSRVQQRAAWETAEQEGTRLTGSERVLQADAGGMGCGAERREGVGRVRLDSQSTSVSVGIEVAPKRACFVIITSFWSKPERGRWDT